MLGWGVQGMRVSQEGQPAETTTRAPPERHVDATELTDDLPPFLGNVIRMVAEEYCGKRQPAAEPAVRRAKGQRAKNREDGEAPLPLRVTAQRNVSEGDGVPFA